MLSMTISTLILAGGMWVHRAFGGWLLIGAIIEERILRETWTVDYHVDIIC